MRILVIGGTRFMGPHVVRRLVELGHRVAVFHRGHDEPELPTGVLRLHGDRCRLRDHAVEFRAFAPEVVLDMIAVTEADGLAAVEAFAGLARRLVLASSMDVYRAYGVLLGTEEGPPQPVPIPEDGELRTRWYPYRGETPRPEKDPARRMDDYDKIPIERAVMGHAQLIGTVLRLPMVYGPEDYQCRLHDPVRRMDDGRPVILLEATHADWRTTRGYVENVAAAIALAVHDERAAGRIYNIGEQDALTEKEWIEAIGRQAQWRGRVLAVSREELPADLHPNMNTAQDLVADCSRFRNELGFTEPVPREQALLQTIAWQRLHHPEKVDKGAFDYSAEDKLLARLAPARDD